MIFNINKMAASHLLTRSLKDRETASDIACLKGDPVLITTSRPSNNITIYSSTNHSEPLAVLEGHSSPVFLLRASLDSKFLCSASRERLLLWQLEVCCQTATPTNEPVSAETQQIILPYNDNISCLCFSSSSQYIAFGCTNKCFVIDKSDTTHIFKELVGHSGNISHISFVPDDDHTHLVTVESKTFKLWNVTKECVLSESNIITSTFTCLSVDTNYIAVGSADGKIRLYSIRDHCSLVRELHLESLIRKLSGLSSFNDSLVNKDVSCLQLLFWPLATPSSEATPSSIRTLVEDTLALVIICTECILVINSLTDEIIYQCHSGGIIRSLGAAGNYELPSNITTGKCLLLSTKEFLVSVEDLFSSNLSLLKFKLPLKVTPPSISPSVLSSEPLVKNSPLKAELIPHSTDTKKPVLKSVRFRDAPVTFKPTVKSSGYTQSPRPHICIVLSSTSNQTKLFQPQTKSFPNKKTVKPKSEKSNPSFDEFDPLNAVLVNSINIHDSRLMHSTYNDNGSQFACVGMTPFIYLVKSTQSSKYSLLQGHEGCVKGVAWSHSNSWLLSCSADKTVRLWSAVDQNCLLTLSNSLHNFKHKTDPDNCVFSTEISNVVFYYLDKFILLTAGNSLHMYKYFIDLSAADDIKRYQTRNYYKRVTTFRQDNSHSITALSAINDFHSYLVCTAGSNRSITIYDINTSQEVWSKSHVHSRPIHWITQNKGSRYSNCSLEMFDIFLTSSINDGMKLWDMRTQKCVRWYTSFQNRSQPVVSSFSPCGHYISTGSEEHSVVVYDLHYISPVAKLHCPASSVITSVSYNPRSTELTACSLEGQLYHFINKT